MISEENIIYVAWLLWALTTFGPTFFVALFTSSSVKSDGKTIVIKLD